MLYKLIHGKPVACPDNGRLSTGEAVTNLPVLFRYDAELARREGYYPLTQADLPEGEGPFVDCYSIVDNQIVQSWVKDLSEES